MRNHPPRRFVLIVPAIALALLAFAASDAGAQTANAANPAASSANPAPPPTNVVYKWKDAHGISQYSQQPPPKGVKYETIENAVASPATAGVGNTQDAQPAPPSDGVGSN